MKPLAVLVLLLLAVAAAPSGAVEPGEALKNPVLEGRAREISKVLRCLVCQNQSIDDSNAGLARDLRLIVRERLTAGDSDDAVLAFVTARYGDFVLLRPPFKRTTWLLWAGPAGFSVFGVIAVVVWFRRRSAVTVETAPLNDDENRRLARLSDDGLSGDPQ